MERIPIEQRLLSRVERITESGCWIWTGRIDRQGYARLSVYHADRGHYVPTLAHRLSFKAFTKKPIDGLAVCHVCDVPCCINPDHLFAAPQSANIADMIKKGRDAGVGKAARQKTHCNAGHPLSGDNLRIEGKNKTRRCKACEKIKKQAKRRKQNDA